MTYLDIFNKYKDILKANGFDVSKDYRDKDTKLFRWSSKDCMKSFTITLLDDIYSIRLTNLNQKINQQSLSFKAEELNTDFAFFYFRQK